MAENQPDIDDSEIEQVPEIIEPELEHEHEPELLHDPELQHDPELLHEPELQHDPELEQEPEIIQEPELVQEPEIKQEPEENIAVEGSEKRWPGWPGESVFRMLVPVQKIGNIIGRKGEFVKKMCEETRSRIKILEGPLGSSERAVMVSAKEEPHVSLPPAIDGLLRVHMRIVDGLDDDASQSVPAVGGKVSTRLLVPAVQASSLIGKQGSTVKSIQEASSCIVRVLDDLPIVALKDDRIVEVVGEPSGVHKAVELIASHLRKFLVDKSVTPLFEMQMQVGNSQMDHHNMALPQISSWGPPAAQHHQGFPTTLGYEANNNPRYLTAAPSFNMQHENYYASGREPPIGSGVHGLSANNNNDQYSGMITQITQEMQIPLAYADAVIGTAGSSISYIRRASGATVAIQESRGVPGEMTVEISGTASQVQAAQQLVQNFMASAGAQGQAGGGSIEQGGAGGGYNASLYSVAGAGSGSMYSSPPPSSQGRGYEGHQAALGGGGYEGYQAAPGGGGYEGHQAALGGGYEGYQAAPGGGGYEGHQAAIGGGGGYEGYYQAAPGGGGGGGGYEGHQAAPGGGGGGYEGHQAAPGGGYGSAGASYGSCAPSNGTNNYGY